MIIIIIIIWSLYDPYPGSRNAQSTTFQPASIIPALCVLTLHSINIAFLNYISTI